MPAAPRRPLAVPLLLLLLAAVACAPGAESGDGGPVVLRFLEGIDPGGGWQEVARRFEARHPGIRVEVVQGPPSSDTRQDLYTTAFLAGEGVYDLVSMDVVWVAKFAAAGWLVPLDDR